MPMPQPCPAPTSLPVSQRAVSCRLNKAARVRRHGRLTTKYSGLALAAPLDPQVAKDVANGVRPQTMKDDEAALYDLAMALYHDKRVSDDVYRAAQQKFGERGIMDI